MASQKKSRNSPISQGRMIRKSISTSDSFSTLSKESQVLFCLLIPHFDSHGKQEGGVGRVKDIACPKINYLTYDNLSTYLTEISTKTDVKWFKTGGIWYLQSLKWKKNKKHRGDRLGGDFLPRFDGRTPGVNPGDVRHEVEVEVEGEVKGEVEVIRLRQVPESKDMTFQNLQETEKDQDLINRILEEGFSKDYEPLYRKAIKEIGRGLVDECLADVRSRVDCGGDIANPSAYFTALLKEQMSLNPPCGKE